MIFMKELERKVYSVIGKDSRQEGVYICTAELPIKDTPNEGHNIKKTLYKDTQSL